jgi:Fe-S cluster assembly protein SufD
MSDTATLVRSTVDVYREQLTLFEGDPTWLRWVRERAFARYAALGLPTLRDEDWKYTSVAPLEKRAYTLAEDAKDASAAARVATLTMAGCARMVFINGHHAPALSDLGPLGRLPDGVTVGSLASRVMQPEAGESWLAGRLTVSAEVPHNGFEALNAALWSDGACIDLTAGTVLAAPLQLLFLTTRPELALFPRNLIRLGAEARAEIIEQHAGVDEGTYFTNTVTGIVLERGAQLTHAKLQEEGRRAWHIADLRTAQGPGSRYASQSFALGAQVARVDIGTHFEAEGCETELLGLYLADGRQHMDHHTRIDHARPGGTSRQLYKGVLDGAARAVFNGKVIVHPDAQGSDAQQSNRNLLLSEQAEVDTKPQLEIYADDVKCSHGATVGQLDPAQIFYLRSRGIDEAAARSLLTHAFAAEVVAQVEIVPLRERLNALLVRRLPVGIEELP